MTTTLKLYDIVDALQTVRDWMTEHEQEIIDGGGELPPALGELLDAVDLQYEEKVERVWLYIRELLVTAEAVKMEEKRLASRRQAMEKSADSLKGYLLRMMLLAERPVVKGKLATVRVQPSPKSVRSVLTAEQIAALMASVPDLVRHSESYTLDKAKVMEYAETGRPLPEGVTIEQGYHIRAA